MAAKKRTRRTRADAEAGIRHCMMLMAEGLWESGASHSVVAQLYKVSPATVKNWATTASRVLLLSAEPNIEEVRKRSLQSLQVIVAKALATGDLRAGVSAIELRAKLLGLIIQKHDVRTTPKVAHLNREEHEKALKELQAEIDAELARIAAEGTT